MWHKIEETEVIFPSMYAGYVLVCDVWISRDFLKLLPEKYDASPAIVFTPDGDTFATFDEGSPRHINFIKHRLLNRGS